MHISFFLHKTPTCLAAFDVIKSSVSGWIKHSPRGGRNQGSKPRILLDVCLKKQVSSSRLKVVQGGSKRKAWLDCVF